MPMKKTDSKRISSFKKNMPSKRKTAKAPIKRWPQIYDLLAWWIWYNLVTNPIEANPDVIDAWIGDVFKTSANHHNIHRKLYKEFKDFRDEFLRPVDDPKQSKKRKTK